MKIEFTPTGGSAATLGDDSVRHTIVLGDIGGVSIEQVEPLMRAAVVTRFARGNVAGEVSFTAAKSHATRDAALSFFKTEYGRLNGKGSMVWTIGAVTATFANAVCRGVARVQLNEGLRWTIRYTFGITTIT